MSQEELSVLITNEQANECDQLTYQPPEVVGLLNTPTLNQIYNLKSENIKMNRLSNEARFDLESANEKYPATLFIEDYTDEKELNLNVKKVLDYLTLCFSQKNSYKEKDSKVKVEIDFSLEELATVLGKPNPTSVSTKKDTRKLLNKALQVIESCSLQTYEKREGTNQFFNKMNFIDDYYIKNSVCVVTFSLNFAKYLIYGYIMQFPLSLFNLDGRCSNAYSIGRKLALHQGIKNNKKKGTSKIISVESLLKVTPVIPSIASIRSSQGSWRQRIEEKLSDALDKLCVNSCEKGKAIDFLEEWDYCNSKGASLIDDQIENLTYYKFTKLFVSFTIQGKK